MHHKSLLLFRISWIINNISCILINVREKKCVQVRLFLILRMFLCFALPSTVDFFNKRFLYSYRVNINDFN